MSAIFPWALAVIGTASVLGLLVAVLGLVFGNDVLYRYGLRTAVVFWAMLVLVLLVFAWVSVGAAS